MYIFYFCMTANSGKYLVSSSYDNKAKVKHSLSLLSKFYKYNGD